MAGTNVRVEMTGRLFDGSAQRIVRQEVEREVLRKVEERLTRKASSRARAGRRNNTITSRALFDQENPELEVTSTLNSPRTVGTAWTDYNLRAASSLIRNVVRKAAQRITEGLNG